MRPAALLSILVLTGLSLCWSGCVATRFSSEERLAAMKPSETLEYSFYVESLHGSIELPHNVETVTMLSSDEEGNTRVHSGVLLETSKTLSLDESDVNQLLFAHYPSVFSKKDWAVPLHVEYSGIITPIGNESKEEFNPLGLIFFWRTQGAGKVTVEILLDNQGRKRIVRIPYKRSRTEAGYLFPLMAIPGRQDWATIWGVGNFPEARKVRPIFADLVAAGVIKALNRMNDEELALLAAQANQTDEQKRLIAWLTGRSGIKVSVDKEGQILVGSEREYVAVPVDMGEARALPKILEQSYNSTTRIGETVVDATGCDAALAVDWMTTRLIPTICKTKEVVFDPEEALPEGAVFQVLSIKQETNNGKDCIGIKFQSLE